MGNDRACTWCSKLLLDALRTINLMLTENAKNAPIPKKMALVSLPVFTYFWGFFGSKLMMMYLLSPYSGNVKNISPIFVIESHLSTQLQVYSKALQVYSKAVFNRSLEKFENIFDGT